MSCILYMLPHYHAYYKKHTHTNTRIYLLPSGCCNVLRNSSTSSLGSPHDGGTLHSQSRWHLYLHSLHFKPEILTIIGIKLVNNLIHIIKDLFIKGTIRFFAFVRHLRTYENTMQQYKTYL